MAEGGKSGRSVQLNRTERQPQVNYGESEGGADRSPTVNFGGCTAPDFAPTACIWRLLVLTAGNVLLICK
jgi:hypothetical protein